MMSRKASMAMAFTILLGLVVAAVLFPQIGKFFFKIVGLVSNNEKDARALNNLDMLRDRIVFVQEQQESSSVVLDMPTNYLLLGFHRDVDEIGLLKEKNWFRGLLGGTFLARGELCSATFERPDACGDEACLCAYHLETGMYNDQNSCQELLPRLAGCATVDDVARIRGMEQRVGMQSRGPDASVGVDDPELFAFTSLQGPRNIKVSVDGTTLVLDARLPS